ncbi:MAG: hypothetical protein KatS3mg060_2960 [Dehalococcoidia bacterium]|nr:MAG: hypothetical protein KatS3mg060_2960 [Dehalococcoidia bacterium]
MSLLVGRIGGAADSREASDSARRLKKTPPTDQHCRLLKLRRFLSE